MEEKNKMHVIVESFQDVRKAFYQLLTQQAEVFGITGVQFYALKTILKHPNIGVTELADRMRLGNSTVSGVVDRLVKAELVQRHRSDSDRRSVTLVLTEAGKEIQRQTDVKYNEMISVVLELGEADVRGMLETHSKLIELLEKAREENSHE